MNIYKIKYLAFATDKTWLSSKSWNRLVTKDTNLKITVDGLRKEVKNQKIEIVKVDEKDNILEHVY